MSVFQIAANHIRLWCGCETWDQWVDAGPPGKWVHMSYPCFRHRKAAP